MIFKIYSVSNNRKVQGSPLKVSCEQMQVRSHAMGGTRSLPRGLSGVDTPQLSSGWMERPLRSQAELAA